jgi:DNA-binding NarL/FixJ family response regulator
MKHPDLRHSVKIASTLPRGGGHTPWYLPFGEETMRTDAQRILIAECYRLVAEALKQILDTDYDVVATVSDGLAMVRSALELRPDLVVLDVALPQLNGLDAGEQLKKELPKVKLLYVSMQLDADVAAEAFRRGGSGYVPKTCCLSELKTAIRKVLNGERYLSPLIAIDSVRGLIHNHARLVDENHRLSRRQKQVLKLLVEGKQMNEVANALNIAPRTVAFHKYQIRERLKMNNDADLVRYALREHMIAA